jgi:biopolymer transport protein ExbB
MQVQTRDRRGWQAAGSLDQHSLSLSSRLASFRNQKIAYWSDKNAVSRTPSYLNGSVARTATAPTAGSPSPATAAAATAVAAPAPALADAAPATQVINNPYGLGALWGQGDFIARGTLIVLAIMSASTWYILVTKLLQQSQLLRQARQSNQTFWKASSVTEGNETLPQKSPFAAIATTGINALSHHEGSLVESIDLNTWVTLSIQRVVEQITSRLQGGLAVLATVGSTAPFVGLFGTVWGIYHALIAIGIAGQASIDKVAGPVGEALIMTALGLATAVPAVLGYNWLVRRNKQAVEKIRGFANDLHSVLISGKALNRPAFTPAATAQVPSRPVSVARTA